MKRILQFIAGFMAAAAAAAAQNVPPAPASAAAESSSPVLAHKPVATPVAPKADPGAAYHPASPAIAEDISSGLPGYSPSQLALKASPPAQGQGAADKPKNQIPRLSPALMSRYFVYGKHLPVFRTRDLYTEAGLVDLALKEHPGLHIGNFFNLNAKIAYATAMNEAMFADRQDLVDTTIAMAAGGDTSEAAEMQQALIDESFENGGQQGPVAVGPAPR